MSAMSVMSTTRATSRRRASFRRGATFSDLAHQYQLGAVLRIFAPHPGQTLYWSLFSGLSLLAGTCCALLMATTFSEESAQGVVPPLALLCGLPLFLVFCLGLGAWILLGPRVEVLRMRVAICERGLLWCGRRLQVIRWEDMHVLWCDASLEHATRVRLTGPDKRFVVVPLYLDEWRTLVRWLERDITARLFPRVLMQYERTHVACFGPLMLTPQGIVLAHRPTIPWHEVYVIEREKMLVLVRREPETGATSVWANIPFTQLPNRCIFEALMKHCVRVSLSPADTMSPPVRARTTRVLTQKHPFLKREARGGN